MWSCAGRGFSNTGTACQPGQSYFAVAADALRVGAVEGQAGEELRRHAPALAGVERAAAGARSCRLRFAQRGEQVALLPHGAEATGVAYVAGVELVVDDERAGVHVAHRIDEAHHSAGATHVEAGQRIAERVEVEERVAGEHVLAVGHQPLVDLALLGVGGVQVVPAVDAAAAGAQAGDPQLCAVAVGERLEPVELGHVLAGDDDADLERPEGGRGKVVHGAAGHVVAAGAAYGVVGGGIDSVEADLDVEVVHRRQPAGLLGVDERAVGGELHPDALLHRVLDQLEEVAAHHGFATADVDVEHLQVAQFVEHALGLGRGQLVWVAPARRRKAVHALQVARVGEFPRITITAGDSIGASASSASVHRSTVCWSVVARRTAATAVCGSSPPATSSAAIRPRCETPMRITIVPPTLASERQSTSCSPSRR